jgi:hypothetical protein
MSRQTIAILALAAVGSAATIAGLVFLALSWSTPVPDSWGFRGFTTIFAVACGGIGALVAQRKPQNIVGWLILVAGVCAGIQVLAEEYAIYGILGREEALPGAAVAGWVETWIWLVIVPLIVVWVIALFPDGEFLTPRWRLLGWMTALASAVGVSGLAFHAGPLNNAPFVDNPFPLFGHFAEIRSGDRSVSMVFFVGFLGVVALAIVAALSVVLRYRRAVGTERQQLKWLALAAVVLAVAGGTTAVAQVAAPDFKPAQTLFIASIAFLPIAMSIAILRHRLYDIDVLINRALVYGVTSAAVGAVFFGGIVVLQTLLRPITGGSQIAVAISTLLCFGLFQPVRERTQRAIDHRFYRARYDAVRTLDAFTDQLGVMVELGAVRASLLEAVGETFEPASASIWLAAVTVPGRLTDRTES